MIYLVVYNSAKTQNVQIKHFSDVEEVKKFSKTNDWLSITLVKNQK